MTIFNAVIRSIKVSTKASTPSQHVYTVVNSVVVIYRSWTHNSDEYGITKSER